MIINYKLCDEIEGHDNHDNSIEIIKELAGGFAYARNGLYFINKESVDSEFLNRLEEMHSQLICNPVKINLFSLSRGIVFGQGTVVSTNGSLIKDSALEFLNHNIPPDGSYYQDKMLIIANNNVVELAGSALVVKRPWYRNYGHWLIDLMPLLPLSKTAGIILDNIIFGNVPDGNVRYMMIKTAELLYPDAKIYFMDDNEVLMAEKLYYIRPVHVPPLFKHPIAVSKTIETVKLLFLKNIKPSSKYIYVSREKASSRKVENEQDLVKYLLEKGFNVIYPEEISLSEQMSLFYNAKIVIGVKGAALANCMFCQEDSHTIALSPSKFIDPFFWDLTAQRRINYSEVYCKEVTQDTSGSRPDDNIYVEMNILINLINKIIKNT